MAMMLVMTGDRKVMGTLTVRGALLTFDWVATASMTASVFGMVLTALTLAFCIVVGAQGIAATEGPRRWSASGREAILRGERRRTRGNADLPRAAPRQCCTAQTMGKLPTPPH